MDIGTREACKVNRFYRMTILAKTTLSNVSLCFVVAILVLSAASVQGITAQDLSVIYLETPSNVTSRTNATFSFNVVDGNGSSPCAVQQDCSFRCKVSNSRVIMFCRSVC